MRVTLIRHAKAKRRGPSDHQRPLSGVGHRQTAQLKTRLKGLIEPDIVVHSDALRTTETAKDLDFDCDYIDLREIYDCGVEQLVDIIRHYGATDTVIVGHEPIISATAYYLTGDERLAWGVGTATAVVMDAGRKLEDLGPKTCRIEEIVLVPARDFK